jgi:hypothetical protein
MKKHTRWQLVKRMANYLDKNKKLSPLNNLEYVFLRDMYWYLTKQELSQEHKKRLYKNYIELINICHFPNCEEISLNWVEIIYTQCKILLDRDYSGPRTFIVLNDNWHWGKMHQVLDLIKLWSVNPLYYGYASEKEFFIVIDFLRKQFNEQRRNIYHEVGKWPREFRKRFGRKDE